jgi:dethiobiotin synthetase
MRLAVAATGTGVGKTTTSLTLLREGRALGLRVAGWKPLETGGTEDGDALVAGSDVPCPTTVQLPEPISPHLAARRAGRPIDVGAIAQASPRPDVDLLVIETAGGLFSPLTEQATNAELIEALDPDRVLLVAPNRLGVLHDVGAVLRASPMLRARLLAIALTGSAASGAARDASTGSNAKELARLHGCAVWSLPTETAAPAPLRDWLAGLRRG